jgi:hypothetical protein
METMVSAGSHDAMGIPPHLAVRERAPFKSAELVGDLDAKSGRDVWRRLDTVPVTELPQST